MSFVFATSHRLRPAPVARRTINHEDRTPRNSQTIARIYDTRSKNVHYYFVRLAIPIDGVGIYIYPSPLITSVCPNILASLLSPVQHEAVADIQKSICLAPMAKLMFKYTPLCTHAPQCPVHVKPPSQSHTSMPSIIFFRTTPSIASEGMGRIVKPV